MVRHLAQSGGTMSSIGDPNSLAKSAKDKSHDSESIVSHIIIRKDNSGGIEVSLSSQACAESAVESASSGEAITSDSASFRVKDNMRGLSKYPKCKKRAKKDNQDVKIQNIPGEGHTRAEIAPTEHTLVSPTLRATECRCEVPSLATALSLPNAMERADISPYTSDEFEEGSSNSDTDKDHSDSSDDDNPKSQVDKLIEQGTQLYMNGEDSALSSEEDSDFDSESDITDVSPIVSTSHSPRTYSPVFPRKNPLPPSPLALHSNGELEFDFIRRTYSQSDHDHNINSETDNRPDEPLNVDVLMKAILELQNENLNKAAGNINEPRNRRKTTKSRHRNSSYHEEQKEESSSLNCAPLSEMIPHQRHQMRRSSGWQNRRKNMSFSNEEVRIIDRNNKILLKKIMAAHSRGGLNNTHRPQQHPAEFVHSGNHQRPTNSSSNNKSHSSVTRKRVEEKIRKDNMILLRKIHEAKPSKDIMERRTHSGSANSARNHPPPHRGSSRRGLRTTSASFGRMPTSPHSLLVPTPQKETDL